MAREISRAQQTLDKGVHGPFAIDSLTKESADVLEATLSIVDWPDVSPLLTVVIEWDTGGGAKFTIDGNQVGLDGKPMTSVKFGVSVPRAAGVKRAVSGGSITVIAHTPVTTALTLGTAVAVAQVREVA